MNHRNNEIKLFQLWFIIAVEQNGDQLILISEFSKVERNSKSQDRMEIWKFLQTCSYFFIPQGLCPSWQVTHIRNIFTTFSSHLRRLSLSENIFFCLTSFPGYFVSPDSPFRRIQRQITLETRLASLIIQNCKLLAFNFDRNILSSKMRMDCISEINNVAQLFFSYEDPILCISDQKVKNFCNAHD